jgi:glutamyl-tRNA reductase
MTGADAAAIAGRLVVVGANHRSSSLALRDRLFVEDAAVGAFLARLRAAGVAEGLVLSTCDRVEVQAADDHPAEAGPRIVETLAAHAGLATADIRGQLYTLTGAEAVRHVFAVTASLDSLMIGEPQVLGQVKACHRLARDAGTVGPDLEVLLQAAYATAKRVRSETAVGERPVSIAAAAVQLARDVHGDLDRCAGVFIGVGDMGELVVQGLTAAGLGHLTVTHPTPARAEAAARALGCHVAPFDGLADLLAKADVVLTSVSTRSHVLTADMVQGALKKRRRKPMFIVDAGIPGDVEPAVNRIEDVFLYDLNDLERVAMEGRATRETEARAAWRIVEEEAATFLRGRAERAAVPTVSELRQHAERLREQAVADAAGDADKATRLLASRLLHAPSEVLRELAAAGGEEWMAAERLLRRLFRLGGGENGR